MGRPAKYEFEEVNVFDKDFKKKFEDLFKEEAKLAEESFSDEIQIRYYLWGRGFEFALELLEREFEKKEQSRD